YDETDVTGSIVPGGSASVSVGVPGQNVRLSFAGVSGQGVSVRWTSSTIGLATLSTLKPGGTTLGPSATVGTGSGFLDVQMLPATGTYTVLLNPNGSNIGSVTLWLY